LSSFWATRKKKKKNKRFSSGPRYRIENVRVPPQICHLSGLLVRKKGGFSGCRINNVGVPPQTCHLVGPINLVRKKEKRKGELPSSWSTRKKSALVDFCIRNHYYMEDF